MNICRLLMPHCLWEHGCEPEISCFKHICCVQATPLSKLISRHRDRINLGLLRSYDQRGGFILCRFACTLQANLLKFCVVLSMCVPVRAFTPGATHQKIFFWAAQVLRVLSNDRTLVRWRNIVDGCAKGRGGCRRYLGGVPCAVHALCARCAKSWPFSTTGSWISSEDWKDVIEWLLQWTGL